MIKKQQRLKKSSKLTAKRDALNSLEAFLVVKLEEDRILNKGITLILKLAEDNFKGCQDRGIRVNSRILAFVIGWGKYYYKSPNTSSIYRKWVAFISTYATSEQTQIDIRGLENDNK